MWLENDEYYITKDKLKFDFNNYNYDELIEERNTLFKKIKEYENHIKTGKIEQYLEKYEDDNIDEDSAMLNYLYNLYAFAALSKKIAEDYKKKVKSNGSLFIID